MIYHRTYGKKQYSIDLFCCFVYSGLVLSNGLILYITLDLWAKKENVSREGLGMGQNTQVTTKKYLSCATIY